MYKCHYCDNIVDNYVPEGCCSGRDCGCMGMPIEPPICDECSGSDGIWNNIEKKLEENKMNYTKTAELIKSVYHAYDEYEDTLTTINFHSALIKARLKLIVEPLEFHSFDEEYLNKRKEYWNNLSEELKEKHDDIYYNVDSDDHK
jgi:hypothetical protein